jgi:OOP family OmpA-OmpF porin
MKISGLLFVAAGLVAGLGGVGCSAEAQVTTKEPKSEPPPRRDDPPPPAPPPPAPAPPTQLVGLPLTGSQIDVLGEIEYDTNSATIKQTPQNIGLLTTLVTAGKAYPMITKLRVEGHTDSDGDDVSNQDLSERRAQSVVNWLVDRGIERHRLHAVGCGERDPVASNDTSEGKQRNRRTEFDIEDIGGQRWDQATNACAVNPQRRVVVVTK